MRTTAEKTTAKARLEEIKDAIYPFALIHVSRDLPDDHEFLSGITAGQYRQVRRALGLINAAISECDSTPAASCSASGNGEVNQK